MEGKNRNDLVFELYYSYNLENLNYHLNDRLNKLLITIQLLLSSAVFGNLDRSFPDFHLNIIIGFILAILSVLSLVYGFGEKAALSKVAKAQYQPLFKRYSTMTDEELNQALITELSCCQLFVAKFCGEKF